MIDRFFDWYANAPLVEVVRVGTITAYLFGIITGAMISYAVLR
jgi:hypothetical protein